MSWQMPEEPFVDGAGESPVETVIVPRTRDLGGFEVRRALPSRRRRMVGPFIFFDQMGPVVFGAGKGVDVRPHPHIGLATVTYLFEGELLHRDSLGTVQVIRPGAVNWMTAGAGIVHSERTPPESRAGGAPLFGIQTWVALPSRDEEIAPAFIHVPPGSLPVVEGDGVRMRVIAGTLHGARSPVRVFSETLYADAILDGGTRLEFPAGPEERAVFVAQGSLEAAGAPFATGQLLVLRPGAPLVLEASSPSRVLLLGGEPMEEPRHIWWNFVSSSRERIEQAAAEWSAGRFPAVPEETERIPLPDEPRIARYP
jgi:redox-sensitive bicupin YhaK (pirin superfamily)